MTDAGCEREFCPREGVVEERASPATLAGATAGDVRARVRTAALAATAIWALYVLVEALRGNLDAVLVGTASGAALGAAGLLWASRPAGGAGHLAALGSSYMVLTAFAVSAAELHAGLGGGIGAGVSWNAVWVSFLPFVVPCAPDKALLKAMIAASMTPLAFVLFVVLPGRSIPPAVELLALFAPVYIAAAMAWAGARLFARIGSELSEARSVGRYELIRRIGEGGMGEVWEARHRLLARPVAIKIVKGGADSTRRARFVREAQATASLESPHTVELYDFGTTDGGEMFYVMELLEGMDLEELVGRHGPMPPERVVHVLVQALDSLSEAHARGLVHRDVKPANLHLGRRGLRSDHLKVLDFGLVKSSPTASALQPTLTAEGRIHGTPAYLAPESITGTGEVDGRADVYALACVAYFLLTGQRVFATDDVLRAAVAHVTETPERPSRSGVAVPADLEAVIMASLEKDPARRPDASRMREMLEACALDPWTEEDARRWWANAERSGVRALPAQTAPTLLRAALAG